MRISSSHTKSNPKYLNPTLSHTPAMDLTLAMNPINIDAPPSL